MIHRAIQVAVVTLSCVLVGCGHPLQSNEVFSVPTQKIERSVSMGETIWWGFVCPCFERYVAERTIGIDGREAIRQNSIWDAEYQNTETGALYLVSDEYHPALAVVLKDGSVDPEAAIVQFQGGKRWRTWSLANPDDRNGFHREGYSYQAESWRLQYLGLDGESSTVLRFSIEELSGSSRDERVGQVEYTHDMSKGRDFVIRGVRITILDVEGDGRMNYTATDD